METSLLRASSSLLPFGRARRLGSGRLPLAVLPGHDAVVLAGRRVGTGRGGGALTVSLKAPARDVKAAYTKACTAPEMGDDDGFDKMYVQNKLKDVAERCITLNRDAMRRLPRAERRRFDKIFWMVHLAFATVRSMATEGRATLSMAVVIIDKLDIVRRMVSSACRAPLPLDMKERTKLSVGFTDTAFPEDSRAEVLVFAMIDDLYKTVQSDIDSMISVAPRE
ncbi:unnamed protein product [Urochloa decumbens]|uniref:Uncharacterized protein n=1 Tax=Urochloa decumbens TaxID=240449 RepID=A0ABC9A8Y3_9POAL